MQSCRNNTLDTRFSNTAPVLGRVAFLLLVICYVGHSVAEHPAEEKTDEPDYGPAIQTVRRVAEEEIQRGILTGVSVAMIDGQDVIMADGFGFANKELEIPANSDTVYRVGSISKLFTALATMQLVEQGKIDIDAPVTDYLPEFSIVNPFGRDKYVTLRQLMCHRSGITREAPVGGYLDDSQAGIDRSVASLKSCVMVNPPNRITRYSNIGVTVVGQTVAAVSGKPFQQYQQECLLDPLEMTGSGWVADERVRKNLAQGYMRIADARGGFTHQPSPLFELGTIPAGNFYSSVNDMTRFARMLLAEGEASKGRIVGSETLKQMATPQLIDSDTGFGIGFFADRFAGHRTMQHTGAVYGFSTSFVVLPEPTIAVIVMSNEDIASGPVRRISQTALDAMLHAKLGKEIVTPPPAVEIAIGELSKFVGQYESAAHWADVTLDGKRLGVNIAGQPDTLRPIGPKTFEANGRRSDRSTVKFNSDDDGNVVSFSALGQTFSRVPDLTLPIPEAWQKYLGSYGPSFIPVVISARHGHLYAMTENMVDYRLTPLNQTVFKMPAGLYADEELVFQLDSDGSVHSVCLASMTLKTRCDSE